MDKQPVGQLPDLTQSNNDDEIMVITNSEYNQLKKEKISDLITDFTSTNENNALTKGTDGKMFVTDFGNADNITEGTLPVSVLPDIPKDLLPAIETSDLPVSGVTAGKYIYPTNMQVNSKGQIVSVENGVTADITKEQIDIVTARKLTTTAYTQEQYPDEYSYWVDQAHSTFDLSKFEVVGSLTISEDGIASGFSNWQGGKRITIPNINLANTWKIVCKFKTSSEIIGENTVFQIMTGNVDLNMCYFNPSSIKFIYHLEDGTQDYTGANINYTFNANTDYVIALEYTGTNYILTLYSQDYQRLNQTTYNMSQKLKGITTDNKTIMLGCRRFPETLGELNGSIDLKSFAVWSDGQPVFSGNKTAIDTINDTLEIPYTETTDGTKIVDAAYFDRVQSCREQTGQALYLTLDEQNQQFFLPQGTVSGMISQNKQKIDELDTTLTADILQAMPVGASIAYEGTTAPEGWFAENGLEVQKSEYPKLYAVVGDKYNLETTQEGYFRLPDTNVSSRFYEGSTTPGTLKDAGLPNITSNATGFGVGSTLNLANGGATSVNYSLESERIDGGNQTGRPILFNASRSNSVYGKSTTVQPKSITKFFIIKHD